MKLFANRVSSTWKCVVKNSAAASGLDRKEWWLITDVCPEHGSGSGRTDATFIITHLPCILLPQDVSANLPAP